MLQFGSIGWLSYDIQKFCQIEINIGKNLIMILYTNKVLIYRRLYFLFTFLCGKIYLVGQYNINELKLKKLQKATKKYIERNSIILTMDGNFFFFFSSLFIVIWIRLGKRLGLILDKIQTFIFSTYNYFNICPKTINFNLVYFFPL